jgi:hypothetical protein
MNGKGDELKFPDDPADSSIIGHNRKITIRLSKRALWIIKYIFMMCPNPDYPAQQNEHQRRWMLNDWKRSWCFSGKNSYELQSAGVSSATVFVSIKRSMTLVPLTVTSI